MIAVGFHLFLPQDLRLVEGIVMFVNELRPISLDNAIGRYWADVEGTQLWPQT